MSVCPYCGCGCKLRFIVERGMVVKVLPEATDDVSGGKPCVKGLTLHEVLRKGRIVKPMIRRSKSSKLRVVSWEKAYQFIYKKLRKISPREIFLVPSGKVTNEDNYVLQKFGRVCFQTNNIDACCTRLCHRATVEGLKNIFGISGNPWRMDEVLDRDCILVIGSNPANNYPVLFSRMLKAKEKGAKILSVQSIVNETCEHADVYVINYPGTETVLLNGLMRFLIETESYDKSAEKVEGFKQLVDLVESFTVEVVCSLCKIRKGEFLDLATSIANSKAFGAIHGMGLTQHVNSIENIHSLLNLVLLKNGKLLSSRGEVNVQGVGDMGCTPEALPLGGMVKLQKLRRLWGKKIPMWKGKSLVEALLISPVKAMLVSGFNPAQSMPNLKVVHKNLERIFLVQMDSYFNLTSKFADVILPTPILLERTGTVTTGERRIRFVRKVLQSLGKPEWVIVKELSKVFGCGRYFDYKSELEIFKEISEVIPAYSKVDVDFVYGGNDCWADKEIKFKRFIPEDFEGVEEIRSDKYPFVLTTFRSKYQFLTGEMTSKSKILMRFYEDCCYINKKDAEKLKLKDGDKVKITSSTGSLVVKVRIDKRIPPGVVGMHFHSKRLLVNKLFPTQFDEETMTPNFKLVAVNIRKR